MKIGKTLHLEIKDPINKTINRYRCKIIEKNEEYLFIDYPIFENTMKTSFFPIGTRFLAFYIADAQNVYRFSTQLIRKVDYLQVPALAINMPDKNQIKRIQRREYVRVPTAIDIAVHCEENSFPPFTTVTADISGGGLAFVIPRGQSLEINKRLNIWMVLHMSSGEHIYIVIDVDVIRIKSHDSSIQIASAKFISISTKTQQKIIQYCFEKLRQARKKELSSS